MAASRAVAAVVARLGRSVICSTPRPCSPVRPARRRGRAPARTSTPAPSPATRGAPPTSRGVTTPAPPVTARRTRARATPGAPRRAPRGSVRPAPALAPDLLELRDREADEPAVLLRHRDVLVPDEEDQGTIERAAADHDAAAPVRGEGTHDRHGSGNACEPLVSLELEEERV